MRKPIGFWKLCVKVLFLYSVLISCTESTNNLINQPVALNNESITLGVLVKNSTLKKVILDVESNGGYANLSLSVGNELLVDNIDIPDTGRFILNALVEFGTVGSKEITLSKQGSELVIHRLGIMEVEGLEMPMFMDISEEVGLDTEATWKYGGPTVADINNNGYYDFILNNHHQVPAQLFWNLGNGRVKEYHQPIARWDLHGSAAGDYDLDGDLDIIITQGGGNGTTPQPPNVLRNDNGIFNSVAQEVGIKLGSRGRAARWVDMDLDGYLDLILVNAEGINTTDSTQHIFYHNQGNGTFKYRRCTGIENAKAERLLVTDINNDHVDDLILYEPLSIWIGNGDFSFTNVSNEWLSPDMDGLEYISAITDIDVDNDGDLDLYLARGKTYYQIANKSFDFNAREEKLHIRDEGNKAVTSIEFEADELVVSGIFLWYRLFDGKYPIYLGSDKKQYNLPLQVWNISDADSLEISPEMAEGWPAERLNNGWYLGYIGKGKWKLEWVRTENIYWGMRITIDGVKEVYSDWPPQNRNVQDVLLLNNNNAFQDVSDTWNIPIGGNHWGVTRGDFNNDGHTDLYVYRFGFLRGRVADWIMLNNGTGQFEIMTSTETHDVNDLGHGDMGQAFDFDMDGRVDLLNGSDNPGKWYIYKNMTETQNNYLQVRVGYSFHENIDPLSATVSVETKRGTFTQRVGSSGEIHSQSLLNIVHFGVGLEERIKKVTITWRNGEEVIVVDPVVNTQIIAGKLKVL